MTRALAAIGALLALTACGTPHATITVPSTSIPAPPAAPVMAAEPAPSPSPARAFSTDPGPATSPTVAEPLAVPPNLAAWAEQHQPRGTAGNVDDVATLPTGEDAPPEEETVADDYDELVGPFDEELIEELTAPDTALPGAPVPPEGPPEVAYDLPIEKDHPRVQGYIELYQTVRRANFERGLKRVRIYEDRMKDILAEEGVPRDLYYLALIESAYNPIAYSRARAMGVWQFIESTGRIYGLTRDWWVDERRDPEKSARAAARHLRDLYAEFGSWPLALAAYNAGAGRVRRAIAQKGTTDFWALTNLPSQTRNYVPAFMAATVIAKEPEAHGFQPDYEPELSYELVSVDECTDVEILADCAGVPVETIRRLNPQLLRWCTPPVEGDYRVAVPAGTGERFREQYAQVPRDRRVSWRRYQIVRGDTVSAIARKFGAPMEAILEVNRLTKKSLIRAGDFLLIPMPGGTAALTPEEKEKVASFIGAKAKPGSRPAKVTYRVRPGDNLWLISKRHGVRVDDLRSWNPGVDPQRLHAGDLLTVFSREAVPVAAADRRAATTYQVRKGDSFWSIARRFDLDLEELLRHNGFQADRRLMPGETIAIPGPRDL